MAQINLYVPDELAALWREQARRCGLPLSRFLVERLETPSGAEWPAGYFEKVCGFLTEDMPIPDDPPPPPLEPDSEFV